MKCDELKDYSVLDIEVIDDERFKKEKAPGKFVPESRVYLKEDVDAVIAELKQKLEDAGMRERRLKRALWLARAECCHRLDVDRYLRKHPNSWYNEICLTWADSCIAMEVKMCKAESKCRAKAEEYK